MTREKNSAKTGLVAFLLVLFVSVAGVLWAAGPKDKASLTPRASAADQGGQYAGGDACFACHDFEASFKKNPHYKIWNDADKTWAQKGCESCHGPGQAHIDGGGDKSQIFRFTEASREKINDTCLGCHLQNTHSQANFLRNAHGLQDVACTDCHSIHKSQTEANLLKARQPALCYDCHSDVRAQFNKPFHHRIEEGLMKCTDCHDQHGGFLGREGHWPAQMKTTDGSDTACFACHADKQGPFVFEHLSARVEGCADCHSPHGSANPRLLKRSEVRTLCLECHAGDTKALGVQPPGFHNVTQVEWQNCTSCHREIHGSNISPVFFE